MRKNILKFVLIKKLPINISVSISKNVNMNLKPIALYLKKRVQPQFKNGDEKL